MTDTPPPTPTTAAHHQRPFPRDPGRWEKERSHALRTGHARDHTCTAACEVVLVHERTRWGWLAWTVPADGSAPEIPHQIGVLTPGATRRQRLALRWLTRRPARRLGLMVTVPGAGHAAGFPAGIRRGVMAADSFTQITNGLFRDTRLSFKAKGLFGLLSTHRDGWRMSVSDLVRRGRDGEAAVQSGLKELEKHGFLVRERERGPDGTLGAAVYVITDLPAWHRSRSQPESGFPPVDDPTLADRPRKNTNRKKTTQHNTSPLHPCRGDAPRAPERTDGPDTPTSSPAAPAADEMPPPGILLLLELGAARPQLLLTGQALTDQGRVVSVMLESGWSPEQLRHVIAARPLPHPVRTTVGAIIAARLRAAQAYPPAALAADHHGPPAGATPATQPVSASAAARSVSEALTYRALVECAGCGHPATAPGEDLCPACLGWPLCSTCPGPTPRRARPGGDGRCTTCARALTAPLEGSSL
ncbi:hypothetical protein [Streptomyces pseudovenezuelae]|uniref:Helix-turn-helix domain-containing protein n=1 Tax=Streptomyces pseudovenezuelae TaxID=67350 RepID=A0ABT6M428_9ACTN|nr:hypothetical protein [Streptomyces pseudovenezuelae]MDH6222880.1 hypothetical protein [Streptomyces pseudovenezuelae]